ncbi:MAG: hypothetical protein CMJ85_07375 [Planctomycetes bacterium]|nr:hypothetical protein [Planctomycetota bacterium]
MMRARFLAVLVPLVCASCGSGILGGVLLGNRGGGGGGSESQQPSITLDPAALPLIAVQFPTTYLPSVRVRVRNVAIDLLKQEPFVTVKVNEHDVAGGTGPAILLGDTLIFDQVVDYKVAALFADKPYRDFQVSFSVGIREPNDPTTKDDDVIITKNVAPPARLQFLRPPLITEPVEEKIFVSAAGTDRIQFAVKFLRADSRSDVDFFVVQRDFTVKSDKPDALRPVPLTGVDVTKKVNSTETTWLVSGVVPAARFPSRDFILLVDHQGGNALQTDRDWPAVPPPQVVYEPKIVRWTAGPTPTLGGSLAAIEGFALIPVKNDTGQIEYLFDAIDRITITRNGRSVDVAKEAIRRDLSGEQRLVFLMPPSPDGLPGKASIELALLLVDGTPVSSRVGAEETGSVRYGVPTPVLGPLTSLLPEEAVDVRSGWFFSDDLPGQDLALLTQVGEVAGLALMRRNGLGLFRTAGQPITTRVAGYEAGHAPFALLSGQTDGVGFDDLFVVGGAEPPSTSVGSHALLTATADLAEPFTLIRSTYEFRGINVDASAADFDEDGKMDAVVLPDGQAPAPSPDIWLSIADQPRRVDVTVPTGIGGRRVHANDFDGDGHADIAVAMDVAPFRVYVAFGDGRGGFNRSQIVSYADVKPVSRGLTGLVSYGDGPLTKYRHLCLLSSATVGPKQHPALVPILFNPASRKFIDASANDVLLLTDVEGVFTLGATMDLDANGVDELVVAIPRVTGFLPLTAFLLQRGKPLELEGFFGPDDGLEQVKGLRQVILERRSVGPNLVGLLVLHTEDIGGNKVPAVSVLPRTRNGLTPRNLRLDQSKIPEGVAIGNFDADAVQGDCATAQADGIRIHRAFAPALHEPKPSFVASNPVPGTLVSLPLLPTGDGICWLERDGRLAVRHPNATKIAYSSDLRSYLAGNRGAAVDDRSRVFVRNVDSDGLVDLCITLKVQHKDERFAVLYLPGKSVAAGELPFVLPKAGLLVDAEAAAFSVGNLLSHDAHDDPGIEMVYAVHDQFRFVWIDVLTNGVFESTAPLGVLAPVHVDPSVMSPVMADLDQDGTEDLAFLVPNARRVRVLFNRIRRIGPRSYQGALVSFLGPTLSYAGTALGLVAADMNGNTLPDLAVVGTVLRNKSNEGSVCLFRNLGRGSFGECYLFPSFNFGSEQKAFAVGDLDGNGMSDVILGRNVLLNR